MKRMFNLDKWRVLREGQAMRFDSSKPRMVRLEVNSTGETLIYVSTRLEGISQEDLRFLCKVTGRETLEFHVGGPFGLFATGDECSVYTVDGERWSYVNTSGESFTRIAPKRVRSPEIEYMQRVMHLNMEKRLARQAEEFRALLEARERASRPVDPVPGGGASAGGVEGSGEGAVAGEKPLAEAGRPRAGRGKATEGA